MKYSSFTLTRGLVIALALPAVLAVVAQLAYGASVAVLVSAITIIAIGLYTFRIAGAANAGAWVVLLYVAGNVLIALYAKTIFGQTLDSHLYVPEMAFFAIFIATLSLVLAFFIVESIPIRRPLLQTPDDSFSLSVLSWGSLFLGLAAWVLNYNAHSVDGSGFGGFSAFRALLLMAVIARTAMILKTSQNRRTLDAPLIGILIVCVSLGLVDNSKAQSAYPVISYFATVFFLTGRLPLRHLAALVIGGVFAVSLLFPLIHVWRKGGVQDMPIADRLSMMQDHLSGLFSQSGDGVAYVQRHAATAFVGGYYDYFGGGGQMLLGRYTSVQQVDPVIMMAHDHGYMGVKILWHSVERLIPSFLHPSKPRTTAAFDIVVHYRLYNPMGGKYPTVPAAGQAFASYGYVGVMVGCFFTFLLFFLSYRLLAWNMQNNIFAIFFFCGFVIVHAGQGSINHYLGAALRGFPLYAIVFAALLALPALLSVRPRGPRVKTTSCQT